jgi:Methane oxygenase PmoA
MKQLRQHSVNRFAIFFWGLMTVIGSTFVAAAAPPTVSFVRNDRELAINIGDQPVAIYCWKDDKITHPFFSQLHAPSGVQATRNHPPVPGEDLMDHDTLHPGVWMSFGDINGSDYWRLKARVEQVDFVDPPQGGPGVGSFAVHNRYLSQADPAQAVCDELARYKIMVRPEGYLLLWDSIFTGERTFAFGDQEEMGLGLRIATQIRAADKAEGKVPPGNGTILDSQGRKNEKEVWGNAGDWCDYSGSIDNQHVGLTILCHPDNFRPSWFHARDRGLLEANPFGRKAFEKGETSSVVVKPGEKLRLRYGILIHSSRKDTKPDLAAAYQDYVQQAGK